MKKIIRLGSRGSPLALLQAEEASKKILATNPTMAEILEIEIVPIRTNGDWRPGQVEVSFRENGGNKELFTKEIETALLENHIDAAVHSMKDLATHLPQGLVIAAILDRIDPRDAFIGRTAASLDNLPTGASVGTSSVRRQAQIMARRPDLNIVALRGNVETRLQKLNDGQADAIILAMAGLIRLGQQHVATSILEPDVMLPSAAQGAIGLEIRSDDHDMKKLLAPIHAPLSGACVVAERALLKILDGSCHTPIGALATCQDNKLHLEGLIARPDGSSLVRMQTTGAVSEAESLGLQLGHTMRRSVPADLFAA